MSWVIEIFVMNLFLVVWRAWLGLVWGTIPDADLISQKNMTFAGEAPGCQSCQGTARSLVHEARHRPCKSDILFNNRNNEMEHTEATKSRSNTTMRRLVLQPRGKKKVTPRHPLDLS
jgi:hypothetical protein